MSLDVTMEGVRKHDNEQINKMEAIRDSCIEAGVCVPQEVTEYLDDPDRAIVGKLRPGIERGVVVETNDGIEVVEIDLTEIDQDIDIIRITRTW